MDPHSHCSPDVDADSKDISDTSGKDTTSEFTANIPERCSVRTVQTSSTAIVDPVSAFIEPSAFPSHAEKNNNSNGSSSSGHENVDGRESLSTAGVVGNGTTSFIQQCVESLFGPGALAQGFYIRKKLRGSSLARSLVPRPGKTDTSDLTRNSTNGDLPVMRHLSQEFRAQLLTTSPKMNFMRSCASKENIVSSMNGGSVDPSKVALEGGDASKHADEVTNKIVAANVTTLLVELPTESSETQKELSVIATTTTECLAEKDGNHFMLLLKNEQARLLAMAFEVDKYIDALTDNPEIAEDTFGLMRSALGQARLLVTKKMKQFESLCHNNLNPLPEDKFPTTLDDLQGFWDMINLQVDDIDMKFAEIEAIKNNDWKHPNETAMPVPNSRKSRKPIQNVNSVGAKPASTANGGPAAAETSE